MSGGYHHDPHYVPSGQQYPPGLNAPSSEEDPNDFNRAQGSGPYASSSSPSLPRYSSGHSSVSSGINYLPQLSPLNPSAARPNQGGQLQSPQSRYSAYGYPSVNSGPAHPLSNAMYLESSPTLAGSDALSPTDEKRADKMGDYGTPRTGTSSGSGSLSSRRANRPGGLAGIYRFLSGATIGDSGKNERHVKLPRLGYIDGCKFIAAWVVLNGTLFDAVLTSNDYTVIQRSSPLYITRSTGLGISFLLLLLGRSLITPLWDVPSPTQAGAKPGTALISWARLTRAMLVRPFRFILPVIAIVALQWGLGASGKTANCNAVGMDEPYWGLIRNFAGFTTLVFDLFTFYEQDTIAGKTFGANLFTMPWFFQSSYAVYVTHMMLGNLSSNRYWVYVIMCAFSWLTYNYFFLAFLGLILADMHAHGHLHTIRTKWPVYQRLALHGTLIAVAVVTQFVPVVRDNINRGMAYINVQDHPELTFCDAIFAFCWMSAIETSGIAQRILGNVVMRSLGKLTAGLFLLAPALTFTIVPNVALSLHGNGSSASAVLGISWLALFGAALGFAILFHFFVELPSKLCGEIFADFVEGDTGPPSGYVKARDGKLLKRNPGGGGGKLEKPVRA